MRRMIRPLVLISINVLVDDALGEHRPRLLLPNVINKLSNARRGHVVDDDVRLGGKALEEIDHAVKMCDLPAVVRSASGPEKEMATLVAQPLQRLSRSVQKLAIGIDECEVHIHEDVGVFHARLAKRRGTTTTP